MLARLKEYKELITIVLFFLGGFFWIENRYVQTTELNGVNARFDTVAKEDSLNILNCKVDKYMRLTQLQVEAAEVKELIEGLEDDLASFQVASVEVTPAMRNAIQRSEKELSNQLDRLFAVDTEVRALSDELARQVCSEVA